MTIQEKIRQLLDHAASTPNEGEANLYFEKAQELMTRYNIEESALPSGRAGSSIIRVDDFISAPYLMEQVSLLNLVLTHNLCMLVYRPKAKGATKIDYSIFGSQANIEYCQYLFNSLQFQVARNLNHIDGKLERRNYFLGFINGVGKILPKAKAKAEASVSPQEKQTFGLVSVKKVAEIKQAIAKEIGTTREVPIKHKTTDANSFLRGLADGKNANLARGRLT